jgi:hypothetical protein
VLVKCDVTDCIYNEHGKCEAGVISIAEVSGKIVECETFQLREEA